MFFRIFAMFIMIAVIPLFVMRGILLINIKDRLYSERVDNIKEHVSTLAGQMVEKNYFGGENRDVLFDQMVLLANIYDGRIVAIDSDYEAVADTYLRIYDKAVISENALQCMSSGESIWNYNENVDMIEMAVPVKDATDIVTGALLISTSTATKTEAYEHIRWVSAVIVSVIAVIVLILTFWTSREFANPFKKMVKSINHISEGHFDNDVHFKGYTELEQIIHAFNKMLRKLKALEESRQEFVSNVSHELKTPLTSMKVLADSLNMQPNVPKEVYQEFMRDITAEIDRENQIITDLLSLVKMDKKSGDLNISLVNINDMIEMIFKRLRPIASRRNIELAFESYKMVVTHVDEVKMTLAISNLIENAIKYNVAGGWVKVSLDMDYTYFYVQVADSGIGIPEEYQDKIFERFYRVDKARSRETGGTGLGLAITKNIVLMHNGNIRVRSKEDEGTVFIVRIPLAQAPEESRG